MTKGNPHHPLFHWGPEHDASLARLWAEGVSANEISKRIGVNSRNAVIGRARRLKLPAHPTMQPPRTKSAPPPTPMGRRGALASSLAAAARRVDAGEGTVPRLSRIGFETRRFAWE